MRARVSLTVGSVVVRTPCAILVGTGLVAILASDTRAQSDHLQCHKVKDSVKFSGALVALDAQRAAFQLPEDCKVSGKAVEFCVPVGKTVTDPGDAPGSPVGAGQDLSENDYLCYKVKCPKTTIADTSATDQFATHTLQKIKTAGKLCVPTAKACVEDSDCDDQNACTTDSCEAAGCIRTPLDDDGDACTTDTCDPGTGNVFHSFVCTPGVLPDSTSEFCTNGVSPVSCSPPTTPVGQDGHYKIAVPSYNVLDSVVSDDVTQLSWQQDFGTNVSSADAGTYCANLSNGGYTDWRVPTRNELITIVNGQAIVPPFDGAAFPAIPQNSFFRTSTPVAGQIGQSWAINTNYPYLASIVDTDPWLVRCVRGTAAGGALVNATPNVIYDPNTNLSWQKAVIVNRTWADALAACEISTLDGYTDWRLPNVKELASVVDDTLTDPAISPLFTDRPSLAFWSSSPVPSAPNTAYAIRFSDGASSGIGTSLTALLQVRCVR